jgi:hypothetical protein
VRRSHRRHATGLAPAGPRVTGFAREREIDRCDAAGLIQASAGTRFPMKGMILFVTGLGIIFLASAVQTFGTNWLGQVCPYPGPCFRPEWLAVGIALSAAAYIAWKVDKSRH